MSQSKFSGVNESKLFGKPETTAFRRYAQLKYFWVGIMFDFLIIYRCDRGVLGGALLVGAAKVGH